MNLQLFSEKIPNSSIWLKICIKIYLKSIVNSGVEWVSVSVD